MSAVVMLLGTGHLGGPILDRLAASPSVDRVVAVGRDPRHGHCRSNLARLTAMSRGHAAAVSFRAADLQRAGTVAAIVREVKPEVVIHTASLQTWWLADLLPAPQRDRVRRIGYGPWVSLHLALALALMRELDEADYSGDIFNAAYPDVVNVVLGRVGRAPTGGLGNIDELVAKVRLGVADVFGGDRDFEVRLVAHHALQRFAFAAADADAGAPPPSRRQAEPSVPSFRLQVTRAGEDVTEAIGAEEILLRPCPLPAGPAWGGFSAAAAVAFLEAWLSDESSLQHCAGPGGLPGGYPVAVGGGRLTLLELAGVSHDEAVAVNESAQQFDGIEAIGDDGTIEIAPAPAAAMRELLSFDCRRLKPVDAAAAGRELLEKFRRFALAHGVDVGRVAG